MVLVFFVFEGLVGLQSLWTCGHKPYALSTRATDSLKFALHPSSVFGRALGLVF